MERFLRFAIVGTIGFVVDALFVLSLTRYAELPPLPARLVSFLCAAAVTFALNWRFTFQLGRPRFNRLGAYWIATGAGAAINIGIYEFWMMKIGSTPLDLILGTAAGSLSAMTFNYFAGRRFVFRHSMAA